MDPSTAPPAAPSTWRRKVRRRSLCGAGVPPTEASVVRRAQELEEAVWRLRAEKDAAERAAAALRAELDAERGAAESAACEAMLMIARLQREKAAAMMEARELRGLAESRACRDRDLQGRLAAVSELAAFYAALLRARGGVDPEDVRGGGNHDEEEEDVGDHSVEHLEAEAEPDGESHGGDAEAAGLVAEEPAALLSPSRYTVDVQCVPCAVKTRAVAPAALLEESDVHVAVAGDASLYARVAALEETAAMRKEVAALRAERALVVLAWRRCLQPAADETRAVVVGVADKPRFFSMFAICKWVFSAIVWRTSSGSSAASLLRQLMLRERSKGDNRRIQITRPPPHNKLGL
ncbi:unnamed protein product [Urochloa humidicola]